MKALLAHALQFRKCSLLCQRTDLWNVLVSLSILKDEGCRQSCRKYTHYYSCTDNNRDNEDVLADLDLERTLV